MECDHTITYFSKNKNKMIIYIYIYVNIYQYKFTGYRNLTQSSAGEREREMGGGVLRTAAKAAALIGYRSVGHPAASRASRPSSAVVSAVAPATEAGPSISVASSHNGLLEAAPEIQGLAWEFDDWEVADWEEEEKDVTLDSLHPAPRLVFGPVASLEEAKEATSDLKDALDM